MSSVARAFAEHRREEIIRPRPQAVAVTTAPLLPWQAMRHGEHPPVMFQLRFRNGSFRSFAYGDLREVYFRDAGHLELGVHGMSRRGIVLEGRNLRELAEYLSSGLIYWIEESDERQPDVPETSPWIEQIRIEEFTGG